MTSLSDHQLVRLARRGNSEAIAVLYRRHLPFLLAESRSYAGGDLEPFDIVQEAWLHMLGELHRFTPTKSFGAWAVTIVRNLGRDEAGGRTRRRRLLEGHSSEVAGSAASCEAPDPLRPQELSESRAVLAEHMTRLSRRQRTALILHVGEEVPSLEVGALMGCSPPTVRTTCYFALARLRRQENILRRQLTM
jgi:RNA polymerase sigma-70 factor (ECF subfamily)